jgi:3-oxoacyl-[acyl-carrier protein] reductase
VNVDLGNRIVMVTGAGRGIGREIAEVAAGAGASVVVVARTKAQVDAVAEGIQAGGGRALALACDITDADAVKAGFEAVVETFGRVDVIVNNAATNSISGLVMAKEEDWRRVYDLNVFALMRCTKAAVRHMIRHKWGRVINVSSVSAETGASFNSAYASSKAAVDGFTRSLAREVAKLGITVNSIRPWHVDTELVHESMGARAKMFGKSTEDYLAHVADQSPQKRLITAREIAALAVFLMSEDARGITGQSWNVDGGFSMSG